MTLVFIIITLDLTVWVVFGLLASGCFGLLLSQVSGFGLGLVICCLVWYLIFGLPVFALVLLILVSFGFCLLILGFYGVLGCIVHIKFLISNFILILLLWVSDLLGVGLFWA